MTGGLDRRTRRAPSLAERTGHDAVPPPHAGIGATGHEPEPHRHCWVLDTGTGVPRSPGLLVEWRQLTGAWQGRVAYVVDDHGEATLVEAWLPAAQLRRASPG